MLVLLIPLLIITVGTFVEVLFVKWFFWALYDVGYVSHSLTMGQAFTVALPLIVASAFGALWNSRG